MPPRATASRRASWRSSGYSARGLSAAAIAERLVISRKTVSTHLQHVMAKLGVHSRAQAVAEAYRLGLAGERARPPVSSVR